MNSWKRPRSLAEVAEWSSSFADAGNHLAGFLHHFAIAPSPAMLAEPPRLLAPHFENGDVCDAYFAAVAATLAPTLGAPRPAWTDAPERFLRKPWFASPGPAMRACLLLESPARFRERNLFVTANALSVA